MYEITVPTYPFEVLEVLYCRIAYFIQINFQISDGQFGNIDQSQGIFCLIMTGEVKEMFPYPAE